MDNVIIFTISPTKSVGQIPYYSIKTTNLKYKDDEDINFDNIRLSDIPKTMAEISNTCNNKYYLGALFEIG